MWMSWETPFLLASKSTNARDPGSRLRGSVRRGGGGVEMCSQSPLESYNFTPLILRGWKLLLSPHLQPCLLLFCCMHFCLPRRGVAAKLVLEEEREKKEKPSYIQQPVLLCWPQGLNTRIPQEESFAAESTQLQETKYYINNGIISNPANIT